MPSDARLLVFLKAPVPGRVKTRLAATLGPAVATRAYVAMARAVRDSVARLRGPRVSWVYEPARGFPDLAWLGRPRGELWRQASGDLGARLAAGFDRAFREGTRRVCAIGADSPDLPAGRLTRAFAALRTRDAVLGPSEDGGYWLIGLRRRAVHWRELFRGMPWSSPRVFAATRAGARGLGLGLAELPAHYDVDAPRDLLRWLAPVRRALV